MIFVSKYGKYQITAKHEGFDRLTGVGTGGGYTVEFRPDVLTAHMAMLRGLAAEGRLKFNGTARNESTNQDLDPAERCSSFDTKLIDDPTLRSQVEKAMLANSSFGQDYWLFEEDVDQAPWPAYDSLVPQGRRTIDMVAEKIVQMTHDSGLDPASVAAYEREHLNRQVVLDALEATKVEADDELVIA